MNQQVWKRFKKHKTALVGLIVLVFFIFLSLFADIVSPYEPDEIFEQALRLDPFSSTDTHSFTLGTDDLGRDLLSRLIYGARISLLVGFLTVILSTIFGTLLGLTAGYYGGFWDRSVMRFVDILMSLPSILLAIVVVSILGPGIVNAIIAVSIVSLPAFIRIVRSSVINEKAKDYVTATRSLGASDFRIIFKNIFPNCLAPLIVQATFGFSEGILGTAALGFLGLGAQAPMAEWGTMLSDARAYIETSPWLVTLPGLCILMVVMAFNMIGDGLRDALDPKLRK